MHFPRTASATSPHRPDEAEAILLQAGLVYRAIKMNIKLFRWDRALDLAKQYKQHVDTVLWYRRRYLLAAQAEETSQRFITEAVSAGGRVEGGTNH